MYIYLSFKSNISKFVRTIWSVFLSNPGPAPHSATPTAPPPYATTPLLSPKLHGVTMGLWLASCEKTLKTRAWNMSKQTEKYTYRKKRFWQFYTTKQTLLNVFQK